MKFTSKLYLVSVLGVLLAIGEAGSTSTHPLGVSVAATSTVQADPARMPAVQLGTASAYYQPVTHWYKDRHWWKRNVPIIGGAAGGAAIGGLFGGGKGAIIGGAIGGTGGYLYKRHKRHQYLHEYGYRHRYRYR
jgi:outer membrane protein with glycine zipper